MDGDIIEAFHENPFNQKEDVEFGCDDTQENYHQVVISPLAEN